ncbi:MAG: hypothetical protein ACRED4_08790, partial [Brevundimonas sp.]
SMADVVVEVMNVELDLANAQVVFDVILADTAIDGGAAPAPDVPDVVRPPVTSGGQEPARKPIARSIPYPTSATENTITITTFSATMADGSVVTIPNGTVSSLAALTTYGVFWKDGVGFEAEVQPSTSHMTTGSWIFIGWQATSGGMGSYPSNPTPPGGWGGDQPAVVTPDM